MGFAICDNTRPRWLFPISPLLPFIFLAFLLKAAQAKRETSNDMQYDAINHGSFVIHAPFIISQLEQNYTGNDILAVEKAFVLLMVDLEEGMGSHDEGIEQISDVQTMIRKQPTAPTTAKLDPTSIEVSNFTRCSPYLYSIFRNCRQAEAQYEVGLYYNFADDELRKNDERIISERYTKVTRDAINDGFLQQYLDALFPNYGISIIGDSKTVNEEFVVSDEYSSSLTIETSINVFTPAGITPDDLNLLKKSLEVLVQNIVLNFKELLGNANLAESSIAVYDSVPCSPDASLNSECQSVFYRYDLYTANPITDQVSDDQHELYSNATLNSILNGTLSQIIKEIEPLSPMEIVTSAAQQPTTPATLQPASPASLQPTTPVTQHLTTLITQQPTTAATQQTTATVTQPTTPANKPVFIAPIATNTRPRTQPNLQESSKEQISSLHWSKRYRNVFIFAGTGMGLILFVGVTCILLTLFWTK